jgi:hypothetical protein
MRRPFVPVGRSGLLVLGFAAASLAIAQCKPLAKKVGEKLVQWGESMKREAEETEPTTSEETASKTEVKNAATTEETVKSASPAGKEEVKAQTAAQTAPKKTPPKPKATAKKKAAPAPRAGTTTNPKKPTKQ